MGFSTTIYTTFDTGQGSNFLNGRGNLPALSTIAANTQGVSAVTPAIKILPGTAGQLSAYLLNYYFIQTAYNGGATYVTNQNGIFSYQDGNNSYPYLLYINRIVQLTGICQQQVRLAHQVYKQVLYIGH